jgi:hypothetical protein
LILQGRKLSSRPWFRQDEVLPASNKSDIDIEAGHGGGDRETRNPGVGAHLVGDDKTKNLFSNYIAHYILQHYCSTCLCPYCQLPYYQNSIYILVPLALGVRTACLSLSLLQTIVLSELNIFRYQRVQQLLVQVQNFVADIIAFYHISSANYCQLTYYLCNNYQYHRLRPVGTEFCHSINCFL